MSCTNRKRLLMQFHITGRCNLRCKHCYRSEGDIEPLSYTDIMSVIEQYKDLLAQYNSLHKTKCRGHINITGGEPFIRKDIKEILCHLGQNRQIFSYGILSNGSFLSDELIAVMKETNVSFVQLSIDGDRKTHDDLRASGDYDRVFSAASFLEKNGIRTYISFTANKMNYKYIPAVIRECRKRRITKIWSDRMVPIGNGMDIKELAIGKCELQDYLRMIGKSRCSLFGRLLYPKTHVALNRALQFIGTDGQYYSCSAADGLITVDESGQVMPCRRMPIVCGDIFSSSLKDIYFNNETFRALRNPSIPRECSSCIHNYVCRGGAKCQSYAVFNSYNRADPACMLADRTVIDSN